MLSGISHDLRTPLTRIKLQLAFIKDKDITKKLVDISHQENLPVNVWTVNKDYDMLKMVEYGVDGIMTDYPLRLKELCVKENINWF